MERILKNFERAYFMKQAIHEDIAKNADAMNRADYSCSESILQAVGKYFLGELDPQLVKTASAFSGGIGNTSEELCGCLSGGLMVIGSLYGRLDLQGDDKHVEFYARKYRELFINEFGAIKCAQVKAINGNPAIPRSCEKIVERSALVLLRFLEPEKAE